MYIFHCLLFPVSSQILFSHSMDFFHPSRWSKKAMIQAPFHQDRWSGQEKEHTPSLAPAPAWPIIVLSLLLTKFTLPWFMPFLLPYFLQPTMDYFPPKLNLLGMHTRSPHPSALPTWYAQLFEQRQSRERVCLFLWEEKSTLSFPDTSLCVGTYLLPGL